MMKSLLLTFLLLGLVAVLKAQEVLSDYQEELSGTWYIKAMVCDKNHTDRKGPKKVFPMMVTALEGGDLEVEITFWKTNQCHKKKIVMHKTDEPGKYTTCNGRKTVYIEELPVKDCYIFYSDGWHHGKYFSIGKLMGRNPEENPEAMEEFKKFVRHKGLKEENILVPELSGESRAAHVSPCVPYATSECHCPQTRSVCMLLSFRYCTFKVPSPLTGWPGPASGLGCGGSELQG
ncbi:odorant-binding protein 2a [Phodopus roborovskii]|uniref:odorant-binding protein 2a n=1 Tax=Phodopus roborovskii TaxID=109678 RepID=UPI0021E371E4|nr:odorant-binding protein 2a [Phodopus roborovskii]